MSRRTPWRKGRALTKEEELLVYELLKERQRLQEELVIIDREILQLMERRAEVRRQRSELTTKAIAEKFEVSQNTINYLTRARSEDFV